MSLYITLSLMTLGAMFVVLLPLGWRRHGAAVTDADVYRAQLAEVDRARADGTIAVDEGETLRTEVARRLIAAAGRDDAGGLSGSTARRRMAAIFAVLAIPAVAVGIYGVTGNPDMPDRPRAARLAPSGQTETGALIARVEDVLRSRPDDGRGWDLLAPIYLRIGRPEDAAKAYANALRLLGSTPEREAGHGEAVTIAAGGIVTADARAAFTRAAAADPANARARYFLARAKAQDGDRAAALADLRELMDTAPADASWRGFIEKAMAELSGGEK